MSYYKYVQRTKGNLALRIKGKYKNNISPNRQYQQRDRNYEKE